MTAHHWLVLILLSLLACAPLLIIWTLDATSDTRATKRRIRGWRRERYDLNPALRRRP